MEQTQDKECVRIFFSDSMTPIGSSNQKLEDVLAGESVPDENDMLDISEVSLLWAYLPEERHPELTPHIARLQGSIKNAPTDFNGWQMIRRDAPLRSFELQLSILMMAVLAQSFREWLNVYFKTQDHQIKLKRVAAARLRELANTPSEISVAKRKYDEAFR